MNAHMIAQLVQKQQACATACKVYHQACGERSVPYLNQ